MSAINLNNDLRDILERISGMCSKIESMLSLCLDGFIKHKIVLIDEAREVSQAIHNEENELISLLSNKATKPDMDKELVKSMMAIVGHFELATNELDVVLQNVRVKVAEGVLFSDKGVNEISHLFRETLTVLKTTGDIILTKNDVLVKHLTDKYASLNQIVDAYSQEHEDRLIKGICQPKSSSLYLNIVDSLMKVVWHMKQAVNRFFGSR